MVFIFHLNFHSSVKMEKKGRVSISLKTKLLILNELQDGKTPTEICRSYNIHKSTLTRTKNNKENLEEFASEWYNDLFIPEVSRLLAAKGLSVKAILLVDNATYYGTANTFSHDENFKVIFFHPTIHLCCNHFTKMS